MLEKTRLKAVGPLPRRSKGRDRAAARAGDHPIIALFGEVDRPAVGRGLGLDLGQQFLREKAHVGIAEPIVFIGAIEAVAAPRALGAFTLPGVTKTPMITGISPRAIKLSNTTGELNCTPS